MRVSEPIRLRIVRRFAAGGVAIILLTGCDTSPAAPQPTVEATPAVSASPAGDTSGSAPTQAEATRTAEPTPVPTQVPTREAKTPEPSATPTPRAEAPPPTERPPKRTTSDGSERAAGDDTVPPSEKVQGTPTSRSKVAGDATRPASSQEQEYTWHDGDRLVRVRLHADLVVQPSSANTDDDVVARDDGETSVVQKQPRHEVAETDPVFRSQGGDLMTLPGGVLLMLDAAWDQTRVNRFFSDNGIDSSGVQRRDFAVNGFLVETEPGFPSLNLANRLAGQEGVLISSPNWRTEVSLR